MEWSDIGWMQCFLRPSPSTPLDVAQRRQQRPTASARVLALPNYTRACSAHFPGQCRWCRSLRELRVSQRVASDTSKLRVACELMRCITCFANSIDVSKLVKWEHASLLRHILPRGVVQTSHGCPSPRHTLQIASMLKGCGHVPSSSQ